MKINGTFSIENGKVTIQYAAQVSVLGFTTTVKDVTIDCDINNVIQELLVLKAACDDGNQIAIMLEMYGKMLGIKEETCNAIAKAIGLGDEI